jgi:hypothetical protein
METGRDSNSVETHTCRTKGCKDEGMQQQAMVLLIIGVALGLGPAMFAISRPRREREPLGPQRIALLSLGIVGGLCIIVAAGFFFAGTG